MNHGLHTAVRTCLALAVSRHAVVNASLAVWNNAREHVGNLFSRQALPMVWDFAEANSFSRASGDFEVGLDCIRRVFEQPITVSGYVHQASATAHPLPNDSAHAFITDPPYYDSVAYAYLSDFFYVWLRRSLSSIHNDLFSQEQVPKDNEIVVDRPHELSNSNKDIVFYERELTKAFTDGCRILCPDGISTIVFASKTTSSWESVIQAILDSGWVITGSWPIDTERQSKVAAIGQARLMSSIHIVCRPRESKERSSSTVDIGDWRDVLQELPERIGEWMPRLASEGIVGADAIFSCLGPALEIFSRYSRVEKASGEQVTLKEYLEHVWAAVAKEALNMIFEGADATGFEEDARLTAMWLWTLSTGNGGGEEQEEESRASTGYTFEFDAARKIAQGLGAHLENLGSLVEIKGDKARLLPVSERMGHLLEKGKRNESRKKKSQQLTFFDAMGAEEEAGITWKEENIPKLGDTILDRVHQSMILFATGRTEALRRFLVEEGVGSDQRFWRLAQALSALYPSNTDEKRWVDGVLARKKGLGF